MQICLQFSHNKFPISFYIITFIYCKVNYQVFFIIIFCVWYGMVCLLYLYYVLSGGTNEKVLLQCEKHYYHYFAICSVFWEEWRCNHDFFGGLMVKFWKVPRSILNEFWFIFFFCNFVLEFSVFKDLKCLSSISSA